VTWELGPIRVLVADDQTLFRNVLSRMLESDPRVEVVGQARDGNEAIEQARATRPNVVLMDLQMPRLDGAEATKILVRESPDVNVLALSAFADTAMVEQALANGAKGFIAKDVTFEDIVARIVEAAPNTRRGARRPKLGLTQREIHVLKQVAAGLSNKQIARRLGLSEKTVRNHLSRAFNKLGATNRTEAVMSAVRVGIVTT
jgi:DNA-binding NarL/FixJ family response regulator